MIRAGANIWSTGVALENPELAGVDKSTQEATSILPGLFGFSGDVIGSAQSIDRKLPGMNSEIRIQLNADSESTLPGAQGFSSGTQYDPDVDTPPSPPGPTTPDPFTQSLGVLPGLSGAASIEPTPEIDASSNGLLPNLRPDNIHAFTWRIADSQSTLPGMAGFSADFNATGSTGELPVVTGEAFGLGDFSHIVVLLPKLAGAIDNTKAQVLEFAQLSDQTTIERIVAVREFLQGIDSFTTQGKFKVDVSEEMVAAAIALVPFTAEVAEALLGTDEATGVSIKLARIFEVLLGADSIKSLATLKLSIALSLAVRDQIQANPHITAEEILAAVVASSAKFNAFVEIVDSLIAVDQVDINGIFLVSTAEQAQLVDSVSTLATLQAAVEEGVATYVSIRAGDEVIQGWVMNTSNAAISQYDNYPFNSFAELHGSYYGAADDGVYELAGNDDAGTAIDAHIKTGLLDMGSHYIKDVKAAHIGFLSTGDLVLKVTTVEHGERKERWYKMKPQSADTMRDGRFTIGRGIRSKYWQFEVANLAGEDFELDQITAMYNVLQRRLR